MVSICPPNAVWLGGGFVSVFGCRFQSNLPGQENMRSLWLFVRLMVILEHVFVYL